MRPTKREILNMVIIPVSCILILAMLCVTWCLVRKRKKASNQGSIEKKIDERGETEKPAADTIKFKVVGDINRGFDVSSDSFKTDFSFANSIDKMESDLSNQQSTSMPPIKSNFDLNIKQSSLKNVSEISNTEYIKKTSSHTADNDLFSDPFQSSTPYRKTSDELIGDIFGTKSYYERKYQLGFTQDFSDEGNSKEIATESGYKEIDTVTKDYTIKRNSNGTITTHINVKEYTTAS